MKFILKIGLAKFLDLNKPKVLCFLSLAFPVVLVMSKSTKLTFPATVEAAQCCLLVDVQTFVTLRHSFQRGSMHTFGFQF